MATRVRCMRDLREVLLSVLAHIEVVYERAVDWCFTLGYFQYASRANVCWHELLLHLLQVWAAADAARYECKCGAIAFRPTLMFQTRTFTFALRNAGFTRMPFRWAVLCGEELDTSGLYKARYHWTGRTTGSGLTNWPSACCNTESKLSPFI